MINQNPGNDKDSQFNFFGKGMDSGTDVDNFWYGQYMELIDGLWENIFTNNSENSKSGSFDAAISYAWNNRTIKAGETKSFKAYMSIGGCGSEVSSRHTHNFTYSLDKTITDNDTIKATCENLDNICDLTSSDRSVALTLSAIMPAYSGSPATINIGTDEQQNMWTNAGLTLPTASDVEHYSGSTLLASAPTTVGEYTAKVTVEGVTASVDYTISKGDPTATAPVAKNLTYNGSEQALVTAGTSSQGILKYSLTKDGDYKDHIPTATNAGTYNVYYKVVGDAKHNDKVFDTPVTVTITKANYIGAKEVSDNILAGHASYGEVILPTIPTNMSYGIPVTDSEEINDISLADGKLTYKGSTFVVNGTDYAITIPVAGKNGANYSDYNIIVTLTGENCTHSNRTKHEKVDATNSATGMKEYWTCDVCNEKLDKDGEVIADESSLVVPIDTNKHVVETKEKGIVNVPEEKQKDNFGSGQLSGSANDIKRAVLTDEDKKAISEGKDIDIWLEVKDLSLTVSQSDKKAVENKMPKDFTVGTYLDINLWKQIGGSDVAKVKEVPNGKVEITITIPEDLRKLDRSFGIVRVHEGRADYLDGRLDSKYRLTFDSDRFSTYAIVYQDKSSQDNIKDTSAPKTGDTNDLWLWSLLMITGLASVGFTMLYGKKNSEERR